jgi:D-glycero-D-manno-heptose 1,7-bisphosphate phosphatase
MGIGAMSRPAVFLDRDGVLVEEIYYPETGETEAPLRPEDVRLLPGAASAARMLAQAGYALILISNQAGYAKGKTSLRTLWLTHERFVALLTREGVTLDGVFYSFSHPNGIMPYFSGPSLERKPGPYNLIVAAAQLDLDLARSWLVGDRDTDATCAEFAGVRAMLVENAKNPVRRPGDVVRAADLAAAAAMIAASDRREPTLSTAELPTIGA